MLESFKNSRLTHFIFIALLVSVMLPTLIAGYIAVQNERHLQFSELQKTHRQMLDILISGMKTPLWDSRLDIAQEVAKPIIADEKFVRLSIIDTESHKIFYEHAKGRVDERQTLSLSGEIKNLDQTIGLVTLVISTHEMEASVNKMVLVFLGIFGAQFVIAFALLLWQIHFKILQPLKKLIYQAQLLSNNHVQTPFVWEGKDEISFVGQSFEKARASIQKMIGEISEEKQKAQVATKMKSEFLANMSHEIRTPINAISGLAYLASKADPKPEIAKYLHNIESSANTLSQIINDILDVSKIEAGKLGLEAVLFDLRDVLEHVRMLTQNRALQKGLGYTIDYPDTLPNAFYGDPLRLGQILTNLMNNAVKFTKEGSVSLRVLPIAKGRYRFEIEDTGIGIAQEQLTKLFVAFSQADTSITREYGGTGLGLSISKQLAQMMEGVIEVKSVLGKGSLFGVEITLKEGDQIPQEASVVSDQESADTLYQRLKMHAGQVILLVEDNEMNAHVLYGILEGSGLVIDNASNGKAAVEIFEANPHRYALILMDIQMPILDGYGAAKLIRAHNTHIPILALSANAMPEDREKSYEAGMNAHLAKPIAPRKLFKALLEALPPCTKPITPTQTSRPQQEQSEVGALVHIDTTLGLAHMASNSALYTKIVRDFASSYEGFDARFTAMLDHSLDEAKRALHTLKGLSASIGALHVSELAALVEEASSPERVDALLQALRLVVEEINAHAWPQEQHVPKKAVSQALLEEEYVALLQGAQKKRPHLCAPHLQSIEGFALDDEDNAVFEKVKAAIESYRYQEAVLMIQDYLHKRHNGA